MTGLRSRGQQEHLQEANCIQFKEVCPGGEGEKRGASVAGPDWALAEGLHQNVYCQA